MTCKYYSDNGICTNEACVVTKCPLLRDHFICRYYKESNVVFRFPTVMELIVNRDSFITTIVADDKDNRSVTYRVEFNRMDTFPMKSDFMVLMPSDVIVLKSRGKEDVIGKLK